LAAASKSFSVEVIDHALAPGLATKHKVRDNGYVVLLKGDEDHERTEQIELGQELTSARSRLRTLDGRFQQTFSTLARQKREVHFTVGHGERSDGRGDGASEEQRTTELLGAL